jgi:hypothetical protein
MWRWLTRKSVPPRAALLEAIPIKNSLARERRTSCGLRLTGPIRRGWRQMLGARSEKTFELDDLGAFVWESLDGKRTVEGVIRHFAGAKRLSLREAEVAVLAFLKTLVQRGLVALATSKSPPAGK